MRVRSWRGLLCGLLTAAALTPPLGIGPVDAAAAPLAALLQPSGIRDVRLSPSGARVAALVEGRHSDSDLLVLEQRQGRLTTLLATHLGAPDAVAGYQWLSDDYLAVNYASGDEEFARFAIADIPGRTIELQDQFTRIAQAPWNDANHVLLSATGPSECRTHSVARCLLVLDVRRRSSTRISDPFTLLPVVFLPVSPTEIYASGRDGTGHARDFQLDTASGAWKPVADGTVQQRRQELQHEAPPPPEVQQQRQHLGMPGAIPVWTEPGHHLVGLEGLAPQRAFVALDTRLDGVQALLEQQYPQARVQISGLNDELTRGMVRIFGPDQPPLYLFFNDAGTLSQYAGLEPELPQATLGRAHVEDSWSPDMPVLVIAPAQGTAPVGAVLEPIIAPASAAAEPLMQYDGLHQSLSQHGIVVVRALVTVPDSFPTNAAGGEWRQAEAARLRRVMSHIRTGLVPGKSVCLLGRGLASTLVLAWSDNVPADCTVAVGARLDPDAYLHPIRIVRSQVPRVAAIRNRLVFLAMPGEVTLQASSAQLHRDLPAQFGVVGSEQLAAPTQWTPQLPANLMLAYDMQLRQQEEFAAESADFRSAAERSGKRVSFYADEAARIDDIQSQDRLFQAVVDYLQVQLTAAK